MGDRLSYLYTCPSLTAKSGKDLERRSTYRGQHWIGTGGGEDPVEAVAGRQVDGSSTTRNVQTTVRCPTLRATPAITPLTPTTMSSKESEDRAKATIQGMYISPAK